MPIRRLLSPSCARRHWLSCLAAVVLLLIDTPVAAPVAAPPTVAAAPEIVVLADRMRRLKLSTRTDRRSGKVTCVCKRRSGDAAFDTMMFDAVVTCAATVKTPAEMEACMATPMAGYARALAARRAPGQPN